MTSEGILPIAFAGLILVALALDLGLFRRKAHTVSPREALIWTIVWISLALTFGGAMLAVRGPDTAIEYLTAYVVEYSLSIDTVFLFGVIFAAFAVPREHQHRVLFWGVLGALGMRLGLILLGAELVEHAHWVLYVFGAFLVFTGIRMLRKREAHGDPTRNPIVRALGRRLRVTSDYAGDRFTVRTAAGRAVTPLFLALLTIEVTDLIFAIDSIPVAFGITTDPLVIYTSNAFAVLGLRSLYFLLAEAVHRFRYLQYGLAVMLLYVGVKLLVSGVVNIPPYISLGVIFGVLTVTVITSLAAERSERAPARMRPSRTAEPEPGWLLKELDLERRRFLAVGEAAAVPRGQSVVRPQGGGPRARHPSHTQHRLRPLYRLRR